MHGSEFEEEGLFRAVEGSGVRTLLFGRRALIAYGIPVSTWDYDFWIDIEGIAAFNAAVEHLGLYPNRSPDDARKVGRYVLENDMRVDVLVARGHSTVDGVRLLFEDAWARRKEMEVAPGVRLGVLSIDDLILSKRFGKRGKDADDIRLLEVYRDKEKK